MDENLAKLLSEMFKSANEAMKTIIDVCRDTTQMLDGVSKDMVEFKDRVENPKKYKKLKNEANKIFYPENNENR